MNCGGLGCFSWVGGDVCFQSSCVPCPRPPPFFSLPFFFLMGFTALYFAHSRLKAVRSHLGQGVASGASVG